MADTPDGWGKDELTTFLDLVRKNHFSFAERKDGFARFQDIDVCFRKVINDALHHSTEWFAGFFILRAHSAFLAACSCASSGQVVEAYALDRVVLEQALYGVFLSRHPDYRVTWLNRHEDEASMKEVKKVFKISDMVEELRALEAKDAEAAEMLYQRTIDFGAHPNERALMQGLKEEDVGKGIRFEVSYLFPDGDALEACRKTTVQAGVCALSMYRPLLRERYDILDITGLLDHLKKDI
ncbi:hypothetical protein [Paraburkholderia flava]|uniref:hypothetical protein n=1 Tax=Paraburkholderia flava TaxID=2547393 RepID=UPI001062359A|nr:hypothetical protein [Paraburkholderia flava]